MDSLHYQKPGVVVHTLVVDSRNHASGSPFKFTVDLAATGVGRYEHVLAVELKSLLFPKIANEPYVVMHVDEFERTVASTDAGTHGAFAVVPFDRSAVATGDLCMIKAGDHYPKVKWFKPALSSLGRFTVRFARHGGQTVSAGDVGNVSTVMFVLQVTTADPQAGVGVRRA